MSRYRVNFLPQRAVAPDLDMRLRLTPVDTPEQSAPSAPDCESDIARLAWVQHTAEGYFPLDADMNVELSSGDVPAAWFAMLLGAGTGYVPPTLCDCGPPTWTADWSPTDADSEWAPVVTPLGTALAVELSRPAAGDNRSGVLTVSAEACGETFGPITLTLADSPGGGWVQKYDNTFWDTGGLDWSGSTWRWPGWNGRARLFSQAWAAGYRPTKIRITISFTAGDDLYIQVKDIDDADLAAPADYTTPGTIVYEADLTFGGDLYQVIFDVAGEFTIDNIEFLE